MEILKFRKKNSIEFCASILLISFFSCISFGAYIQKNVLVILFFATIATVFVGKNANNYILRFINHKFVLIWLVYILVGLLSTLQGETINLYDTVISLLMLYIVFAFTRYWNPLLFFNVFRIYILCLCLITIIGYIFNIDFFSIIKFGSDYPSIDPNTGGVSTIFEFRHYYGCFLAMLLFVQFIIPFKKFWMNGVSVALICSNILLTYTRNIWIAIIICVVLYLLKTNNIKKKHLMIGCILFAFLLVAGILFFDKISGVLGNVANRIFSIFDTSVGSIGGARGYSLVNGVGYVINNWQKYILFGGGNGFAIKWLIANPYEWWSEAIDCQYVTVFMNYGISGFISLIILIVSAMIIFFRTKDKVASIFSISLIAISLAMLFFDLLGTCTSVFVLWTICVCGIEKGENR